MFKYLHKIEGYYGFQWTFLSTGIHIIGYRFESIYDGSIIYAQFNLN